MASVDRGAVTQFIHAESKITPASPEADTTNGGAPATAHGWYGYPGISAVTPGTLEHGYDLGQVARSTSASASGAAGSTTLPSGTVKSFLMRAYETGGSCVGKVPRYWVVTTNPDTTASQYSGTRCSPTPGTLGDIQVIAVWT